MLAHDLMRYQGILSRATEQDQLLREALAAADALLAAMHEALQSPSDATAVNALGAAEKRYSDARQAVDGARK